MGLVSMIRNTIQSRTTQNMTGGMAFVGALLVFLQRQFPALSMSEAWETEITLLLSAVGSALVARLVAFLRNPEKGGQSIRGREIPKSPLPPRRPRVGRCVVFFLLLPALLLSGCITRTYVTEDGTVVEEQMLDREVLGALIGASQEFGPALLSLGQQYIDLRDAQVALGQVEAESGVRELAEIGSWISDVGVLVQGLQGLAANESKSSMPPESKLVPPSLDVDEEVLKLLVRGENLCSQDQ